MMENKKTLKCGSEGALSGVITRCLKLDSRAFAQYWAFAKAAPEDDRRLWLDMAADEKSHVDFWRKCQQMSLEGALPDIFDDCAEIIGRLDGLLDRVPDKPDAGGYDRRKAMCAALDIESHLLMPEFLEMFKFFSDGHDGIAKNYGAHLEKLVKAVNAFPDFADLRFFTENVMALYRKNIDLAMKSLEDPLTSLLNRRGFWQRALPLLDLAAREGKGLALLIADIDHFKRVNDDFGHPEGDRIIAGLARIIKTSTRKYDVACRFGGEEFIIFTMATNLDDTLAISERTRIAIASSLKTTGGKPVTASFGAKFAKVSPISNPASLINELISEADKNLYAAKKSGRNRTVVS